MSEHIKHLTDENFKETVKSGVTLVDFFADWCGPCRRIAPIIEELAAEFAGHVTIGKLDIESAQSTTAAYNVMSIPTLILFKDGQEINRVVGLKDKAGLKELIEKAAS